jgi:hypothetical protein
MVDPTEAAALGLAGSMVEDSELEAARAKRDNARRVEAHHAQEASAAAVDGLASREAAAADAALFESGPYEPQDGASEPPDAAEEPEPAARPSGRRRGGSGETGNG